MLYENDVIHVVSVTNDIFLCVDVDLIICLKVYLQAGNSLGHYNELIHLSSKRVSE